MNKNSRFLRMIEQTLEKPATKTCEACGEEFSCGANVEKCWCFEIDLGAETLAKLQENFRSCLCRNCLLKTDFELQEYARSNDA